ncbi:hypothetical protein QVD17_29764 [Tagetes erecta]|uniref:Matrin-type domain-containing protein n=1 Tax=Tagetes erecta TaxID=13708 RepID=A0AAD8K453_TARER|nr:hypothetical protein QVD17_29764 [Tagetes erecta]
MAMMIERLYIKSDYLALPLYCVFLFGMGQLYHTREMIRRELEKEKIRQEILAEEVERRRILEAEVRRELELETMMMLGQKPVRSYCYEFQPEMMRYDDRFLLEDTVGVAPAAVPIRRRSGSECIGLGLSSGSKRKASTPLIKEDFSCEVCDISVTSERGMQEHLSGKKHKANVAGAKTENKKITKKRKKGKKIKSKRNTSKRPKISS